jgi:cardiolipin synthase
VLVWLSSFSYIAQTKPTGVKFYRYQPGFLHHKVMLVDKQAATIGTANFDNRSFRINFEITMLCADDEFVANVHEMMETDLSRCRRVSPDEYFRKSFFFKMCVRIARLMAPIQ